MKTKTNHYIGYHFAILHRLALALCKQEISHLGIQAGQIGFITELLRRDVPVTQDELSSLLVIDKAATARTLEQLERKGLVSRRINPNNRRQKLVVATERARRIEDEFFSILQDRDRKITQSLSEEELQCAVGIMEKMIHNGKEACGQ